MSKIESGDTAVPMTPLMAAARNLIDHWKHISWTPGTYAHIDALRRALDAEVSAHQSPPAPTA